MKHLLLCILLLVSTTVGALTIEEEIDALVVARDFHIDIISNIGYSVEDHHILIRIYRGIENRRDFIKQRATSGESRYLLVNKSEYYLRVFDSGAEVLREKVVVGQNRRPTPELSDTIKYIVLNPYWNVPPGLARKDIVPKFNRVHNKFGTYRMYQSIKDGGYRFFSFDGEEINPSDIDFSQFDRSSRIPFRIRQEPSDHNSLGIIKFIFPNKYNVYIHDTPHKELFGRVKRNFSSGCVRLQNPTKLAAYLMNTSNNSILRMIENGNRTEKWIKLDNPLPLYIVDWDIIVSDDGVILK